MRRLRRGAPAEGKRAHRMTVRTVFQMVVVGLVTVAIGLPAIALGLLVPGRSRKGKIFRWVTKSYSMILLPVFGVTVETRGVSRVDRRNAMQSRTALSNAASALTGNNSVLIYVEGTRSKDGKLQPLKKGGFHIALRSGMPIVPVRISGSHDIVPPGSLRVRAGDRKSTRLN